MQKITLEFSKSRFYHIIYRSLQASPNISYSCFMPCLPNPEMDLARMGEAAIKWRWYCWFIIRETLTIWEWLNSKCYEDLFNCSTMLCCALFGWWENTGNKNQNIRHNNIFYPRQKNTAMICLVAVEMGQTIWILFVIPCILETKTCIMKKWWMEQMNSNTCLNPIHKMIIVYSQQLRSQNH